MSFLENNTNEYEKLMEMLKKNVIRLRYKMEFKTKNAFLRRNPRK